MGKDMAGRRLTAILAADVAGYSALMGENDVETVAALKGHQSVVLPMISGYSGRVIDTAGDGILAEFGSVYNAVKCAMAIQEVMSERNASVPPDKRMQFRIGINQGDVLFDENRIYGDGINIAARLEGICRPGGICISGKVYEEIRGRFEVFYEDIGEQALKNISDPVRTYRISISGTSSSNDPKRKIIKYLTDNSRIAASAGLTLFITAAAGWWLLNYLRLNEPASSTPVQEEIVKGKSVDLAPDSSVVPKAREGAVVPRETEKVEEKSRPSANEPSDKKLEAAPLPTTRTQVSAKPVKPELFTQSDMQRVKAIGKKNSLVFPEYVIEEPAEDVGPNFRKFVGVWASEVGYGGTGRQAMLVATNVTREGEIEGYQLNGPPTATSFHKGPANYNKFKASIIGEQFSWKSGSTARTATLLSNGSIVVMDRLADGREATVSLKRVWNLVEAERSAKR